MLEIYHCVKYTYLAQLSAESYTIYMSDVKHLSDSLKKFKEERFILTTSIILILTIDLNRIF